MFSLSYLTYSSPVHLKIIVTCSLVKCYRYSLYGYCYQKDLSLVKNSTRILQNALHFRRVIQLQYLTYVKELHMFKLQLNTFFYKHYFTKITFFLWSSGQPGGVQSLSSILHMRMKAQRGCVTGFRSASKKWSGGVSPDGLKEPNVRTRRSWVSPVPWDGCSCS